MGLSSATPLIGVRGKQVDRILEDSTWAITSKTSLEYKKNSLL